MQRIAFFGGSFDPPHFGHLAVARAAQEALGLDRVLFAPVGAQPLKPNGAEASFADRVAMTRLAIADEPGFEVSLLDAPQESGAPNYTLDTLHELRCQEPQARLFLLLGADSFATLRHWHGATEIPFAATLVIASRPGQFIDNLGLSLPASLHVEPVEAATGGSAEMRTYALRNQCGETAELYLLPGLDVPISASVIRRELHRQAAEENSALVPDAVAEYIRQHGLYQ
jgi:nicotinate-nucleotide adenylyltransferase